MHNLVELLKKIREVDDLEIKDCALDSLIERLEDEENNKERKKKDELEKENY